jgi:hypothetical protein
MVPRRSFLVSAAAVVPVAHLSAQGGPTAEPVGLLPLSIAALTSMCHRAKPITVDERRGRIARAL